MMLKNTLSLATDVIKNDEIIKEVIFMQLQNIQKTKQQIVLFSKWTNKVIYINNFKGRIFLLTKHVNILYMNNKENITFNSKQAWFVWAEETLYWAVIASPEKIKRYDKTTEQNTVKQNSKKIIIHFKNLYFYKTLI